MALLNNNKTTNKVTAPNNGGDFRCDKIHLVPRQSASSKFYFLEAVFKIKNPNYKPQGKLSKEAYAALGVGVTEEFITHQNSGPYDLGITDVNMDTPNHGYALHQFALTKLEGDFTIVDTTI